jgi:hypothetical protein
MLTSLGQETSIDFVMTEEAVEMGEVEVVAERNSMLSASRTGAATAVNTLEFTPFYGQQVKPV